MQRSLWVAAFGLATTLVGANASAQTIPFQRNVDVQSFRPAIGPNNYLTTESARVDGHLTYSIGAFLNYSNSPFAIYTANCPNPQNDSNCSIGTQRSTPVGHLVTLDILASVTLFRRLQIGVDIPISYESGDAIDPTTANRTGPQSAIGVADPRVELKGRIVGDGMSGPGFAISAFAQLPIGHLDAVDHYLGDSTASFGARLIGDFRQGPFSLAANAGVLIRLATLQTYSSYMSNRLTWNLAASYDFTPRISGVLDFFGSTDLINPNYLQQNAAEGDLAGRYRLGDVSISLGGGAGLIRGAGVPLARVFLGLTYAPFHLDSDNDGIQDSEDRCPTQPEDRDGFQDSDGCPDPDNDGDGINDVADRCPSDPEDRDHFLDGDGCPDRDNDGDGIADGYDTCPNVPEDFDGDHDEDGCPDNDRDSDGIPDELDHCPNAAEDTDGFQDEDGCPDPDNDNDGIPDTSDQCSDQPEVYNAYQDDDGCPDTVPDRDHDGIPDGADHCPDQPETYNGIHDEDGCPDGGRTLVVIESGTIRILQQVNFATASNRIVGATSFRVLDQVVAVLRAHEELGRVEVQGHTDNHGVAAANRELSDRRAAAVEQYLVAHGIPAERLQSRGFGPDVPIAPNTNNAGRARNRRVEFHFLGRGAEPTGGANAGSSASPSAAPSPAP